MSRCWFCRSADSMPAFRRSDRVFLLSAFFPRLRWNYCRRCTRPFMALRTRRDRHSDPAPETTAD